MIILDALDELGLALVEHDHIWTDREPALRERRRYLRRLYGDWFVGFREMRSSEALL